MSTWELLRCDGVGCDREGVEFLRGTLPAYNGPLRAKVSIRLWLCPEHAELMLANGMHR